MSVGGNSARVVQEGGRCGGAWRQSKCTSATLESWRAADAGLAIARCALFPLSGAGSAADAGAQDGITDVVVACGSGGTAAGLAIANKLTGSARRIHAISVCDNAAYFHGHVNEVLRALGDAETRSEDILRVVDGYKGLGYAQSTEEELRFCTHVGAATGILLDRVYTGKGEFAEVRIAAPHATCC